MHIIHINGRGGSGKNTLIERINAHFGWEKLPTCTTRPPRFEGETDYYFLTEDEFVSGLKDNTILESYFRRSNKSFYGCRAPDHSGAINTEIMGYVALKKWCFQNNHEFLGIYLDVAEDELLRRISSRNDKNEKPEDRLAEDRYYEQFKDWSDVVYDYNGKTIEEGAQDLISLIEQRFPELKK